VVSTTNGNKYYPYLAKLSFINLDVPNITVCSKQVTQIGIVPQSNFTYSWLPTEGLSNPNIANPTVSLENNTDAPIVKQYIVKASDITCPNAPLVKYDTVKVTVLPAYDALKIFTGSTTVCPSTSGTKYWINANANYDITWNLFGGTIESGQSTDTIRVAWQNPNTNAWVEVKAKHKIYACETIFKLPIVIDNLLKPDKPTGESAFCIESDKVFTYKTSLLNNGSTYLWKTDDNTAIFVGANNQSEVKIRWTTAGIKKLWVVETNQTPCVGSSEILEINVLPIPAPIDIRGANLIPFFASQVRYEVQASTGSTYQWTLAQGGKITEGQGSPAIRIDWEQEGEYLLTVQETNAQGCVGKPSEMRIKVVPFLPPNVITPNGDGKNDTWFLDYIENFSAHKVQIIDRTGKEVYRSTVYKNDWDATGLPADVYFYYLTLHPRIKPMKGTITVIR
jgi:gliding motility-associated-like protein